MKSPHTTIDETYIQSLKCVWNDEPKVIYTKQIREKLDAIAQSKEFDEQCVRGMGAYKQKYVFLYESIPEKIHMLEHKIFHERFNDVWEWCATNIPGVSQ